MAATNGHDPQLSVQTQAIDQLAAQQAQQQRQQQAQQHLLNSIVGQRNAAFDQLALAQAEVNVLRGELADSRQQVVDQKSAMDALRKDMEALGERVEITANAVDSITPLEQDQPPPGG